jgi:hypothetical protein
MIIAQLDYILDTIVKYNLDFENLHDSPYPQMKFYDKFRKFDEKYRSFIHQTWHGIDEKAFYLFKLTYEQDKRWIFEKITEYDNFEEYLPIYI